MDNPPIQLPLNSPEEVSREGPPSPARPDPDNPPWGLPGAVALLILSFLLMVVAQTAIVIPYAVRRGVPLTPKAMSEFAVRDTGAIVLALVALVIAHVLTLGLAWLLVTRAGKYPFLRTLGWEWNGGLTLWRCVGLALGMYLLGMSIIWLAGSPDNELERILRSSRAAALVTAFAATFTAPLVEEIVFRGLLYSALRRLVGAAWAVAVVLLLFAVIHVPQYWPSFGVIGTILLLSIVLTVIRARTGRLLPCFVIHLIFNGIQSLIIVLSPYLERFLPDKAVPAPPPAPVPDPALLLEIFVRLCGAVW